VVSHFLQDVNRSVSRIKAPASFRRCVIWVKNYVTEVKI
jgi:hypothetical protein